MSKTRAKVGPEGMLLWPVKTNPKRGSKPENKTAIQYQEEEETLPETVQGIPVGSKEEARVAVALGIVKIPFIYQYQVEGSQLPGSMKIDFLVQTIPAPTPLFVQSRYWHGPGFVRGDKDKLQQAFLAHRFPGWMPAEEIWDYDVPNVQAAVGQVRMKFGRY